MDSDDKMHPSRKAQTAHLKVDKASIKVFCKYTDFADVFLPKLAVKLPEHTRIKNYAIELVDDQQPLYSSIYSSGPMELETLKAYIENSLANNFIRPSKSPIGTSILFDKMLDGNLRLCVNYQSLNNLTIKN